MMTDSPLILIAGNQPADALALPYIGNPVSLASVDNTGVSGVPGRTRVRKMRNIV